jgi:site-specific DNA-cytosine methylase
MELAAMDFRLGELFCGAGGLAYGAKKAKVTSEITDYTITMYGQTIMTPTHVKHIGKT